MKEIKVFLAFVAVDKCLNYVRLLADKSNAGFPRRLRVNLVVNLWLI